MGIADLNSLAAAIIWNVAETCKQMLHQSLSPLDSYLALCVKQIITYEKTMRHSARWSRSIPGRWQSNRGVFVSALDL